MSTDAPVTDDGEIDAEALDEARLVAWLADAVDPSITGIEISKLANGHSSGAWRLDLRADAPRSLVLKAPTLPSVVYQRDTAREARIYDALHRHGGPVPAIAAIDDTGAAIGRPCFVMEHVDARGLLDTGAAGYHDDPWLKDQSPDDQRAVWDGFYDALAALHSVDPRYVVDARFGPNGLRDVIDHWRASLLDVAEPETVPRHLALLDWAEDNLPADADARPAVCLGDARIANCLFTGTAAAALVDFEVAYIGNPKADVGYSLFFDALQRASAQPPLPGAGTADDAWDRWGTATGRDTDDRAFWTAFSAMVVVITASRAIVQWGLDVTSLDDGNPLVAHWQGAVDEAEGRRTVDGNGARP